MTGFSIVKQDPYQNMRFKLGKYAGDLQRTRQTYTNDVNNATKLQADARRILRGLPPETFAKEFDKLQSNNYRILSEVYKDVQALRTLNFTDQEIRSLLTGRRALSKQDVSMVMLGTFNPEKVPSFKQNTAIANTVKNINRELETNYTIDDFINRDELFEIRSKYIDIPLGLSDAEREEFLRSTLDRKIKTLEPKIKEGFQRIDDQSKAQPVVPAAPFLPDPQISNMFAANINQQTGLTPVEEALLSPTEQIIRRRTRT